MSAAPSHDPRRFSLVVDPSDPGCVLITIRQVRTGQPPATYEGSAAQDRLQRFCAAYLDGAGLLAHAAAARILTSADPKVPTQERLAALLDVAAERVREAGWPVSRVAEELISRGVSGVGREVPFLLEELLGTARTSGLAVDKIGPWRVVLFQDAGIFTLAARLEAATSTEADWIQLARIVWGLGAPKDPVIPIDQLAATHAIVWRWPAPTTTARGSA